MRIELTEKERNYFVILVSKAQKQLPHKIANPNSVKMYWNDKYNVENGILGSFNWIKKGEIDLSPLGKTVPDMIVSTVAHELHHKWQFSHFGPLYCLMLVPGIRQVLLERSAKEVELKVDELMEDEEFTKGERESP